MCGKRRAARPRFPPMLLGLRAGFAKDAGTRVGWVEPRVVQSWPWVLLWFRACCVLDVCYVFLFIRAFVNMRFVKHGN